MDEPVLSIDTVGKRCPIPIIELARHIGRVDVGQVIEVLSDDEAARIDVPEWCRMRGQHYVGERAALDGTGYLVRRCI